MQSGVRMMNLELKLEGLSDEELEGEDFFGGEFGEAGDERVDRMKLVFGFHGEEEAGRPGQGHEAYQDEEKKVSCERGAKRRKLQERGRGEESATRREREADRGRLT